MTNAQKSNDKCLTTNIAHLFNVLRDAPAVHVILLLDSDARGYLPLVVADLVPGVQHLMALLVFRAISILQRRLRWRGE